MELLTNISAADVAPFIVIKADHSISGKLLKSWLPTQPGPLQSVCRENQPPHRPPGRERVAHTLSPTSGLRLQMSNRFSRTIYSSRLDAKGKCDKLSPKFMVKSKSPMERLKSLLQKWNADGIKASIRRKKARRINRRLEDSVTGTHSLGLGSKSKLERHIINRFRSATREHVRSAFYTPKVDQPITLESIPVKVVAFYLPQFHPIPENNQWWGAGFTEWTNVSKAQPQFLGHYQPHIPSELGFYDLRLIDTIRDQANLARHYGIQAFCFHYYWFNGRRLLEKPLNLFLQNKDINQDFCLCWANENWTRRWDGLESEVLMEQHYSASDDIAFIKELSDTFNDSRYIKIEGKPLLIIYRASRIPDLAATVTRWRTTALQEGFPGLYLVTAESIDKTDPRTYGFDAAVEFPPHQTHLEDISGKLDIINPIYQGHAYDYAKLPDDFGKKQGVGYELFKTVMPSWDNEARKPGKGDAFVNSTPEHYARWLKNAIDLTMQKAPDRRLLFINAWNEWGEGAHLEPDLANGYAYLHATAAELAQRCDHSKLEEAVAQHNASYRKRNRTAIIYHSYYDDLIQEVIEAKIAPLHTLADAVITIRSNTPLDVLDRLKAVVPHAYFIVTINIGRDILPFLKSLQFVSSQGYDYFCKIHSKKSPQHLNGSAVRQHLIDSLLPASLSKIRSVLNRFDQEPKLSCLAPAGSLRDLRDPVLHRGNSKWLNQLMRELGLTAEIGKYRYSFPAGTMFWGRTTAFSRLLNDEIFATTRFEPELGQLDGTLAHAIERLIGLIATENGYQMLECDPNPQEATR